MSDIDISALHLHDQFGSDHLTARDLDFYSLLRRRGEDGSLYFNRQRALLFESDAIGKLRQQLITHVGLQQTMEILFRFGYAQGDKDASILGNDVNWASDADWLAAGTMLPMLSGMARIETQVLEYDRETGQFYMKGVWHNSYEAKEHLAHFGSNDEPVCWALAGYASAYSSRFFDRDLLALETECVAKGDPHCVWEIKPVGEWGDEARPYLNALHNSSQADQFSQTHANFIIENSPVVVFRWRAIEGYPVEYVSANIEQFGYTSQEFVSGETSYPSIVHPDDLNRALGEIEHNSEQGIDSFTVEYRLVTKTGEIRWVDTKLTLERDTVGQVSHFLGVLSDITDRKRAEEEMQRLSLAVEQSANTVIITDVDGYIEYANPKFEETTGYRLDEAIGKHTRILKSGQTPADEYRRLWETISAGQQWRGEFHNRKKNGELYWESAVISPIKNSAGEITNYLAIKEDISQQRFAQEALARRAVELETVAQVSVAATKIFELDQLLQAVVDLTKERFNLCHVNIYLLNSDGVTLELAAGAGQVGQTMVSQGWQIALDNPESIVAQAAQTRVGVIANDVTHSSEHLPHAVSTESQSQLAVPLIAGDDLLGVFDVHADAPHHFTQDDVRIQTMLAAQVAVAIQNARLFQQTREALARTESLNQIVRAVVASETLSELIQTAAEGVARNLGADWVQVLTIDEGEERIIEAAEAGSGTSRMTSPHLKPSFEELYRGQTGRAMREHAAVVVSAGISEPPAEIEAYWLPDISDVGALMVVPIYYRDKALGAIITTNRIGQPAFSQDDVEFLESLTNQMASILENRVLLKKMQGTLAELEATQRRYTVQAWDSYLTQFQTRQYERNLENEETSLTLMSSELESVIDNGQTVVISDRLTQRNAESGEQPSESRASKLLVPLKIRDEVIGVLGLQEADTTRHWTTEEIALVEAVAEQMAQAAENLRLLDETQRRAAREQRVNEIGAKIRAAHSLEEALQIAVREVGLSLGAPQTSVQLRVE